MTIYILLEEGEFVAAYRTHKEAEKAAMDNEMHNFHIIETPLKGATA
jgi:hypothetical protein